MFSSTWCYSHTWSRGYSHTWSRCYSHISSRCYNWNPCTNRWKLQDILKLSNWQRLRTLAWLQADPVWRFLCSYKMSSLLTFTWSLKIEQISDISTDFTTGLFSSVGGKLFSAKISFSNPKRGVVLSFIRTETVWPLLPTITAGSEGFTKHSRLVWKHFEFPLVITSSVRAFRSFNILFAVST